MQHLYRKQMFATIEQLMDAIYNSFFTIPNHAAASCPRLSAKVEHLKATHDWTQWLLEASKEHAAAACVVEKFARHVPDSHRPHEFEFTKQLLDGKLEVVMNYKHWCHDESFWNPSPIRVLNYIPDLKELQPARLRTVCIRVLSECVAAPTFEDSHLLCQSEKLKNCPRCKVVIGFKEKQRHGEGENCFTPNDITAWATRFRDMNPTYAQNWLAQRPLRLLDPGTAPKPTPLTKIPEQLQEPSAKYLMVPPVTHHGYSEADYQRKRKQAGAQVIKLRKEVLDAETLASGNITVGSDGSVDFDVFDVVAAFRKHDASIEVAVVWSEGNDPKQGGTWIPLEDLNASRQESGAWTRQHRHIPIEPSEDTFIQQQNWERYFGRGLEEDLELVCGFQHRGTLTTYKAMLQLSNYDPEEGLQTIVFPKQSANQRLGTSQHESRSEEVVRLDQLLVSSDEDECPMRFWASQTTWRYHLYSRKSKYGCQEA